MRLASQESNDHVRQTIQSAREMLISISAPNSASSSGQSDSASKKFVKSSLSDSSSDSETLSYDWRKFVKSKSSSSCSDSENEQEVVKHLVPKSSNHRQKRRKSSAKSSSDSDNSEDGRKFVKIRAGKSQRLATPPLPDLGENSSANMHSEILQALRDEFRQPPNQVSDDKSSDKETEIHEAVDNANIDDTEENIMPTTSEGSNENSRYRLRQC